MVGADEITNIHYPDAIPNIWLMADMVNLLGHQMISMRHFHVGRRIYVLRLYWQMDERMDQSAFDHLMMNKE